MGQIVGGAAKPKRCNLNKLSQLGTPAAGEYILVSSDNSMNAAGQGNFDAYVVGDGHTAAIELPLQKFKAEELDEQINGVDDEVITVSVPATAGTAITNATKYDCRLMAGKTYTLVYTGTIKNISIYFRDSSDVAAGVYADGETTTRTQFSMTTGITTRIVVPSVDIYYVKFYAIAAHVPNTETAYFVFTWESTDTGLVGRISSMEGKMVDKETLSNYVKVSRGKNLYDSKTKTSGKYFNIRGVINDNSNYSISDFIPVKELQTYCCTAHGGTALTTSTAATHVLYDANKVQQAVVASNETTLTTLAGTAYIRLTIFNTLTEVQVEEGSQRTSYEEFSEIGGYPSPAIEDGSIGFDKLSTDVKTAINATGSVAFDSFSGASELAKDETLSLLPNHVSKNTLLVAKVSGTIEDISIGVGYSANSTFLYRSYSGHWVEIDQTNVKLYSYWNGTSWRLDATYQHGLNLTAHTTIQVDSTMSNDGVKTNTLKIYTDKGDVFTQAVNWGIGKPFATNNGNSVVGIELKFFARDITHNVWLFGDSMFSYWPPIVQEMGYVHYLSNNVPGLNPEGAFADLESLLGLGYKPSYILWCLGANGERNAETYSDGEWHISSMQKAYIDSVISICENYDITPVFMVVPTFPTRQRQGFANYLRSLNVRLWDLAAAVQSDEYGIWHSSPSLIAWHNSSKGYIYTAVRAAESPMSVGNYLFDSAGNKLTSVITAIDGSTISTEIDGATYIFDMSSADDISGIVSSDGLHPTPNGAKVYAQSVLVDFPELSIVE